MVYKVIIIGSGPAGLTAGVYAGRLKLNPLIVEGFLPGGQLMTTGDVENWPGNISIKGPELIRNMHKHAEVCGCSFLVDTVESVDFSKKPFVLHTKNKQFLQTESVIIATGSSSRKLGCPGEKEYWGKGVNTCAVCDAPLYDGKVVAIVGGGNSAITEAYAISKYAKKVIIVQLHDKITATDSLMDTVLANPKVQLIYNGLIKEIKGDGKRLTTVVIENQKDKTLFDLPVEGLFVAIGQKPNSLPFKGGIQISKTGHILRSENMQTNIEGVFVVGDVADYKYKQAITAAGDGCAAVLECIRFLKSKK